MPNRRVVLIEQPPDIWHKDGLVYVDFRIEGGALLAYRPSVLLAAHARCDAAIREWHSKSAEIVWCRREAPG